MATKVFEPITPIQRIQHERFTTKQHGYHLEYLSLDVSGNIAVSGYHSSRRTYIDLYSGKISDSRDKLKFFPQKFEKYSFYRYRYVSFLNKNVSKLLTCIGDKIEIIDAKNESEVLRSCRVNGDTSCPAVREGEIFIGLRGSQTVLVLDNDLTETKQIRIKGIQDGDWPRDLQVIKDTVFVCTYYGRVLSLSLHDSSIVSEYTDTTGMYGTAISVAVSEKINLVAVLWYKYPKTGIIVYCLNKNKSLLVFGVDNDVHRIRISDRDRMIITGNRDTGEIKMYYWEQLFSFAAMKRTLACLMSPEECEKLREYFGVTEEEIRRLEAGNMQMFAMTDMMTRQKAWEDERSQLSSKPETAESKVKRIQTLTEELQKLKRESHEKIENLSIEVRETKQRLFLRNEELETTNKDLELTKQTLEETKQDRDYTRSELKQYQLDFAKESNALKEVLNQRSVDDKTLLDSDETRDKNDATLAAEFGRLTVAIAEYLTLDHCLKLVRFCNIPTSDCDRMLRVYMNDSPGMKLLDVLKKRKVINMFDVTNLQKALAVLQMEVVYHDLVAPYQENIDKEQYELYKVEKTYTCEEVNAAKDLSTQRKVRDSQTSLIDETDFEYAPQKEATAQHTEPGDGRRSFLGGRHHHQLYTEYGIGKEGGTIQLGNVSLTVPPDALHESHVIALSVMNEFPFPLEREVDTARMTPLIKLEPLGLMFEKSLQLNIPHSALIPEPDHHAVIIYSGQITRNDGDSSVSVKWTEDKSVPRQLKEKSVTVDIQCLTYLSASLVSQSSAPPLYIVRVVPFVDGVRNTDDDIILTICVCSDNDSEYNMLLSDYNTKLPLEQYSTIQLHRHSEKDEDDAGYLNVTVTSRNNSYVPDADQEVKQFSISHLCTASRVSHQLKLLKNREIDRDDVQVVLTFSQAGSTLTKIFMKARIKDLLISQESEDLLIGSVSTALKSYDELKENISSMLENYHCIQLATYFDLTPAEAERVTADASPGNKLIKILDEREKIMPQKMFDLYQGLKACHLDKIARLVFEYTEKNSNETRKEKHENEMDKYAEGIPENVSVSQQPLQKRQNRRSRIDKSVQTIVSSTSSSSDSVLTMLNQELRLDEDKMSHHRPYTTMKWMKEHLDFMGYILPMFVDGILQTQRGIFTLPRVFKN